jgi:hypothetical protein
MREIRGKIGCEQLAQLVIWQGFIEREEMHAVYVAAKMARIRAGNDRKRCFGFRES